MAVVSHRRSAELRPARQRRSTPGFSSTCCVRCSSSAATRELVDRLGRLHAVDARREEHGADEQLASLVADLDPDIVLPLATA
jgi:hypothetical protein